jgi:hypothetical protein
MKYAYAIVLAALASLVAATPNPYPVPNAKPIPQAPKATAPKANPKGAGVGGAACESNAWEKIHEGHGHNVNDGTVGGANLGLKLPGGNGCYKGAKSP